MPREVQRPGASRRQPAAFSPQKSPFKSSIRLPLNDDRQEKSVRFKSRQALQEVQMNSLKAAAASPARKSQSIGVSGSPRTPNGANKENEDQIQVVGNVVTPLKRGVPILANFEEWMKMATDNKINANNSWNFALIDYFHDMSLLREGDSVNFQKASCTLDGCVKIYTSRVDSVATETGKLLSGLADGNSKKRRGDDEAENDEEEGEEGEDGVKKKPRKRVQRSSEVTLASSFAQLQLKKMDLEFSVDPLFKKASADFDEGGAKGLLLNHLTIDPQGRIVFDSSDDTQEVQTYEPGVEAEPPDERARLNESQDKSEALATETAKIDIEALATQFFPDLDILDGQDICPSLKTFELDGDAATLDIPFLKAGSDWRKDLDRSKADDSPDPSLGTQPFSNDADDDDGADLGGFDAGDDIGFGEGGEAWAREAAIEPQQRPYDIALDQDNNPDDPNDDPSLDQQGQVGAYNADSTSYGIVLSHNDAHDTENILSYFDRALAKNWAGPEHWRIRKVKDASSITTKPAPRQRKEKEPFTIDFLAPLTRAQYHAIYTPAATPSAITLPKSQWKSKTRNLLPDDKHFDSKQLLRLFLKPKARIGARSLNPTSSSAYANTPHPYPAAEEAEVDPEQMDSAFWARRHAEQAALAAAEADGAAAAKGDYDANFFQDDALGPPADIDIDIDDDDGGDAGGAEFADARERLTPETIDVSGDVGASQDTLGAGTGGFGSQLVTQSRRSRPEYVQYARVAKKVDVRRLKEEMWRGMPSLSSSSPPPSLAQPTSTSSASSTEDGATKAQIKEEEPLKFTDVMQGLQSVYPVQAMNDISTSYCFICLLHLANEKGLELRNVMPKEANARLGVKDAEGVGVSGGGGGENEQKGPGMFEEILVKRDWSFDAEGGMHDA